MSEIPALSPSIVEPSAAVATAPRMKTTQNALPAGARMGEFEIIGLVGEGGFGIVYLAYDHSLQRRVALKEYMPVSLAARNSNGSISVRSEENMDAFAAGRSSFVNEARLLAQFDHAALVKVFRFWEANGTAYMVMPYYEGKTLRQIFKERPNLDEAWIKRFLAPILDALDLIHRENCFHRDISPDNIIVMENDHPVLLDFGAARRVIGDLTHALTVFVKHSYAPIEQYAEMPELKQGAWTDIYTLATLVYFMIARKLPPPSVNRLVQDKYEPLSKVAVGRYSESLLSGIDICLRVRPEQRPQNIAEMRLLLGIRHKSRSKSARNEQEERARRSRRSTSESGTRSIDTKTLQKHSLLRLASQRLPVGVSLGTIVVLGGLAYYVGQLSVASSNSAVPSSASAPAQAPLVVASAPLASASATVPVVSALAQSAPSPTENKTGRTPESAESPTAAAKSNTTPATTAHKPAHTTARKSSSAHKAKDKKTENSGIVGAVSSWAKRTFSGSSNSK